MGEVVRSSESGEDFSSMNTVRNCVGVSGRLKYD